MLAYVPFHHALYIVLGLPLLRRHLLAILLYNSMFNNHLVVRLLVKIALVRCQLGVLVKHVLGLAPVVQHYAHCLSP